MKTFYKNKTTIYLFAIRRIPFKMEKNWNKHWFQFVLDNLHLTWSWRSLSCNPNINMEIVKENMHLPWNWKSMSCNVNLTWDFIVNTQFPDNVWDWNLLSSNKNIDMDIIKQNIEKPWNYYEVSLNPNLTWEFIDDHREKKWNWSFISQHKCVTLDIIKHNQDNQSYKWCRYHMSKNGNITWEMIQSNPDINWDLNGFCLNPNITLDIVKSIEPNMPDYYWKTLSSNRSLTWDFVKTFPNKYWCWEKLSCHPNITMEIFEANRNYPWNIYWLHLNKNFDLHVAKKFISENVNENYFIYSSRNITFENMQNEHFIIMNSIGDTRGVSANPNLSWDIVEENKQTIQWCWRTLSENKFIKEKELFECRIKHQNFIQENVFENLVKIALHPSKINKYLNMGYSIDELDNIL